MRAQAVSMDAGQPKRRGRSGKYVWLVAAIITLTGGVIGGLWLLVDHRSADERLADFEAGRTVPDAENAALIYNELLADPCTASLLEAHLSNLEESSVIQRRDELWSSEDDPELAAWIEDCAPILNKLLEAARLEACWFPIGTDLPDLNQLDRFAPVWQWSYLLSIAFNNDLAEGRLEGAVTKWRCLIQMGNHLRQQPFVLDHLLANNTTTLALRSMVRFVATRSPSAGYLQEIEAMPFPLADGWPELRAQIETIDYLTQLRLKESVGLWDRFKSPFTIYRLKRIISKVPSDPIERIGNGYRYNFATACGLRIVIALRQYRDETNQWPEDLHEIEASLPEGLLTDPISGDPFVYCRLQNGFKLYSKGRNRIDEGGTWELKGADDWSIWPLPQPQPKHKPEPEPDLTDKGAEETMEQLKEIYGERCQTGKPEDGNGV